MQTPPVSMPQASPRELVPRRAPSEDVWETLRARDLEEKMGQGTAHGEATILFVDVTEVLLSGQERTAHLGWDVFVEWDPNDPRARVSPDVFLLDGQPASIAPSIWQTWLPGCDPPRFVLEIVSERSRAKDYETSPLKYAALGTEELVIFDAKPRGEEAFALQIFQRTARGQFLRVYAGPGPVESTVLRAWLVVTDSGARVRLARDAEARDLVPTRKEQAQAATQQAQAATQQAQAATARAETAEAEVRRLRDELARLGAKG